jgi:hypothetical protein
MSCRRSSLRRSDAVLRVLGDMTKASYEPSQPLCSFLLDAALFTCDNKVSSSFAVFRCLFPLLLAFSPSFPAVCVCVLTLSLSLSRQLLRVLASWFVDNFPVRLDRGIITRMLQVSWSRLCLLLYCTVAAITYL